MVGGCRPNVVDERLSWLAPRGPSPWPESSPWAHAAAVPTGRQAPAAESFSKIVLASSPVFPYSTSSHGGVAQLGERLTGSQEVRGSIPLVSTRALNEAPTQVGAFFHIGAQGDGRPEAPGSRQDGLLSTVFKLYKRKKARDDVWPTENSGGPSGIRTQNPGIMSPLR